MRSSRLACWCRLYLFRLLRTSSFLFFFFFNDTATTEIYTLSLHDALPICARTGPGHAAFSDAQLTGETRPLAGNSLRAQRKSGTVGANSRDRQDTHRFEQSGTGQRPASA